MDIYITTSHLLIHFAILLFPLFVLFFPQYKQSSDAFIMIALTTVLYTNSFGYSCLLIAKGFEKKLGQISFFTLLINIILVYVLIKAFLMPYSYVFAATLFAYFIYALLLSYFGRNILQLNTSLGAIIREIYPNRILLPFLLSLCFTIFKASNVYYISPFVLFILINHKTLQKTKETIKHIIANPKFIDI